MADENDIGLHDLVSPFLFVPHGDPDPVAWKAAHPGWVSFPATMVPRADPPEADAAAEPDRMNWPKDRWGNRYRPFDEYGSGERAPGERSFPSSGFLVLPPTRAAGPIPTIQCSTILSD